MAKVTNKDLENRMFEAFKREMALVDEQGRSKSWVTIAIWEVVEDAARIAARVAIKSR